MMPALCGFSAPVYKPAMRPELQHVIDKCIDHALLVLDALTPAILDKPALYAIAY